MDGVIFHSDRGSEYTAARFQAACRHWGVVQSMGRVGCALDNAAAESFNSILKVEYVHRQRFATRAEARMKIATWISDFYNARRRHTAADGMPPIDYEKKITIARAASRARLQEAIAASRSLHVFRGLTLRRILAIEPFEFWRASSLLLMCRREVRDGVALLVAGFFVQLVDRRACRHHKAHRRSPRMESAIGG